MEWTRVTVFMILCIVSLNVPSVTACIRSYGVLLKTLEGVGTGTKQQVYLKVIQEDGESGWKALPVVGLFGLLETGYGRDDGETKGYLVNLCPKLAMTGGTDHGDFVGIMMKVDKKDDVNDAWKLGWVYMGGVTPVDSWGWRAIHCTFCEWVTPNGNIVGCLRDNKKWMKKIKDKGYFSGDRKIRALHVADRLNCDCVYWDKSGKEKEELKGVNNICKTTTP